MMNRRHFITLLGCAAASWPAAAWAQQGDRVRRIGVLYPGDENAAKPYLSAFTQALADLNWTEGRNVRIDLRRARRVPSCPTSSGSTPDKPGCGKRPCVTRARPTSRTAGVASAVIRRGEGSGDVRFEKADLSLYPASTRFSSRLYQ
jgi:putative ABC transport system substrate-binding protein